MPKATGEFEIASWKGATRLNGLVRTRLQPRMTGPEEQWTCGKGLAEHAAIPAKMADFLESLAENLQAHIPAIDTSDRNGSKERDAYVHLHSEYTAIATHLAATAERMRGCRDLPAAGHHEAVLSGPIIREIFAKFVSIESELADLLRTSADRDQNLL